MIWKECIVLSVALFVICEGRSAFSEVLVKKHIKVHQHSAESKSDQKTPENHEEYENSHPSYEFSYKVIDPHTHDEKGQHETRDGDKVTGHYWLIQPDGRKRLINYKVDGKHGFTADINYALHDEHHKDDSDHHVHESEHGNKDHGKEYDHKSGHEPHEDNHEIKHEEKHEGGIRVEKHEEKHEETHEETHEDNNKENHEEQHENKHDKKDEETHVEKHKEEHEEKHNEEHEDKHEEHEDKHKEEHEESNKRDKKHDDEETEKHNKNEAHNVHDDKNERDHKKDENHHDLWRQIHNWGKLEKEDEHDDVWSWPKKNMWDGKIEHKDDKRHKIHEDRDIHRGNIWSWRKSYDVWEVQHEGGNDKKDKSIKEEHHEKQHEDDSGKGRGQRRNVGLRDYEHRGQPSYHMPIMRPKHIKPKPMKTKPIPHRRRINVN